MISLPGSHLSPPQQTLIEVALSRKKTSALVSCLCLPIGFPLCVSGSILGAFCCIATFPMANADCHERTFSCFFDTLYGERQPQTKADLCIQAILPSPVCNQAIDHCLPRLSSTKFWLNHYLTGPEREKMALLPKPQKKSSSKPLKHLKARGQPEQKPFNLPSPIPEEPSPPSSPLE